MRRSLCATLQDALESVYRVEGPAQVDDFRIDRRELARLLQPGEAAPEREALIVREDDADETGLALFIDDAIAERAERFLGASDVTAEEIDAFCVVTEGVSHFLYLTFCGSTQLRPVSQIELELQAEVDKFLILKLLRPIPELVPQLFDRIRFEAHLSLEEQDRYRVANDRGRRYARWVERRFSRGDGHRALDDARELYRKPLAGKLDHIARAA